MAFHDHGRKHVKLQDQTIGFLPSRCAEIEELHIEISPVRDVQKDAAVFFQNELEAVLNDLRKLRVVRMKGFANRAWIESMGKELGITIEVVGVVGN